MLFWKLLALVSRLVLWVELLLGALLSILRIGVSTPGAGVGSFSGGKGNGSGGHNPHAAGGVVEVPPLRGSSPRDQSGELPAPLPVGEVCSSRKVTFSDTSGPEEVIEAVDLLGGVLAGLGIDIEALKSRCAIPPFT